MPRTLSGLSTGEFDQIDVLNTIHINGSSGQANTCLTSDGKKSDWTGIRTGMIDGLQVTTAKLDNLGVTAGKLASNSVTSDKILDDAVTTNKILDNAVNGDKIADNSITFNLIANGAVSLGKLGAGAVDNTALATNAVTTTRIIDDAVTNDKLQNNSITIDGSSVALGGSITTSHGLSSGTNISIAENGNINSTITNDVDTQGNDLIMGNLQTKGDITYVNNIGDSNVRANILYATTVNANNITGTTQVTGGQANFSYVSAFGQLTGATITGDVTFSNGDNLIMGTQQSKGDITSVSDIGEIYDKVGNIYATNIGTASYKTNNLHATNGTIDTLDTTTLEVGDQPIKPPGYAVSGGSYRRINILPSDFMADNDSSYYNVVSQDSGSNYGWIHTMSTATEMFAYVSVPEQYTPTHLKVFTTNQWMTVQCHRQGMSTTDNTNMLSVGTKYANTEYSLNQYAVSDDQYLVIQVDATSTSDLVAGAYIMILNTGS